jgi:hypothetical protein
MHRRAAGEVFYAAMMPTTTVLIRERTGKYRSGQQRTWRLDNFFFRKERARGYRTGDEHRRPAGRVELIRSPSEPVRSADACDGANGNSISRIARRRRPTDLIHLLVVVVGWWLA